MAVSRPQTEDFFGALLEICPLAIIGLTTEGVVTRWSRGAEHLFGWSEAEALGRILPSVPPQEQQQFQTMLQSNLQGHSYQCVEVTRIRKDGTLIDVSLWTRPIRDSAGNIVGKLALFADITDQRRSEQERSKLLESEQAARQAAKSMDRFRELLEAAPDAIIEVDELGRIKLVNTALEKMFGYSREELIETSVDFLLPQELRFRHEAHRQGYREHPKTRPMGSGLELFGQRKDGSRFPVEISLSPIETEDGFRISAFIRDVTERKQAEEQIQSLNKNFQEELSAKNLELEARNREVERANQLKSEFLSSMSHELRTPLHTIIGFADLLVEEMKGPLNQSQKRFVEHIQRDSRHLLELINGILDLSKIEAGRLELRLEWFNASELIQEVLSSLRPLAANKGIKITEDIVPALWITADRLRFKEILYNLISNAIKFTPEHGEITVQSAEHPGEAFFCVSDTGIGIPQSEQGAIFEKFSQLGPTTQGIREGTGLGLPITKHLIELHGGRIWVESQVGLGSKFQFILPNETEVTEAAHSGT